MIAAGTGYALIGWALTFFCYSSAVLGLAWLADVALRRGPRPLPEIAWRLALVAALAAALPPALRLGPGIEVARIEAAPAAGPLPVAALPEATQPAAQTVEHVVRTGGASPAAQSVAAVADADDARGPDAAQGGGGPFGTIVTSMRDLEDGPARVTRGTFPGGWTTALPLAWLALALVLLARLVHDHVRATRACGPRVPVAEDHPARATLDALCAAAGVRRAPRLTMSPSLSSPVSLLGGEICITAWAFEELDGEQLRGLLAHELAHHVRRDPLWLVALQVIERVFFFQPLLRVAHMRLRVLAELAADDWAAAHTRNGRAIATTLYACAARMGPRPALGVAIAAEPSVLMKRVQRLLSGRMPARATPGPTASVALAGLVLVLASSWPSLRVAQAHAEAPALPAAPAAPAALARPAAPATPAAPAAPAVAAVPDAPARVALPGKGSRSTHINIDDDHGTLKHVADGATLRAQWVREFELNDDESDVAALDRGGRLEIETERGGESRRIVFEERNGEVVHTYYRNRSEQPLDAEGRAWLARTLPELMRVSTLQAEQRVARLLARGGPDAVIAELDRIYGGYGVRVYVEHLVAQADLTDEQIAGVSRRLAETGSDYDVRTGLIALLEHERVSPAAVADVLAAARSIDGSYHRRTLLEHIGARELDATAWELFVEIARGIESDYDLHTAIVSALGNPSLAPADAARLLDLAAAEIESDYDLSQVVLGAHQIATSDEAAAAAVRALGSIESAYDRRVAVEHIVDRARLSREGWLALIEVAGSIDSDYDCAEALSRIATAMPLDDATTAAWRSAADTIESNYDRSRAQQALRARGA